MQQHYTDTHFLRQGQKGSNEMHFETKSPLFLCLESTQAIHCRQCLYRVNHIQFHQRSGCFQDHKWWSLHNSNLLWVYLHLCFQCHMVLSLFKARGSDAVCDTTRPLIPDRRATAGWGRAAIAPGPPLLPHSHPQTHMHSHDPLTPTPHPLSLSHTHICTHTNNEHTRCCSN